MALSDDNLRHTIESKFTNEAEKELARELLAIRERGQHGEQIVKSVCAKLRANPAASAEELMAMLTYETIAYVLAWEDAPALPRVYSEEEVRKAWEDEFEARGLMSREGLLRRLRGEGEEKPLATCPTCGVSRLAFGAARPHCADAFHNPVEDP